MRRVVEVGVLGLVELYTSYLPFESFAWRVICQGDLYLFQSEVDSY